MSRFPFVLFLVLFSGSVLLAQGSKGRTGSGTSPQTSLSPSASASKSVRTSPAPSPSQSQQRNSAPVATQSRTNAPATYGHTTTTTSGNRPSTVQDRGTRPSEIKVNRPATYAPPTTASSTKGTTKGTSNKVAPLKASERGTVNWMTLEQALEKCKTEKRKIVVDMYTDWCGWCKHMDSTTFVNPSVAKYLNEHYYPVKFNAEQEADVTFKDKVYRFKKNGARGQHELAAFWLNNRLSFPTMVFLDENQQLIQPVPGYQDATKMEAIINYFGSDSHKKTPWESYEKNFSNRK